MTVINGEVIIRELSSPFESRGLWGLKKKKEERRKTHKWEERENHTVCRNCGIFKLNDKMTKFCKGRVR